MDGVDADTDGLDEDNNTDNNGGTDADDVVDGVVGDAIDTTVDGVRENILDIAGIKNTYDNKLSIYDGMEGFSYDVDVDSDTELSEVERLKVEEERSHELSELRRMKDVSNANVALSTTSIVKTIGANETGGVIPTVNNNIASVSSTAVLPNVNEKNNSSSDKNEINTSNIGVIPTASLNTIINETPSADSNNNNEPEIIDVSPIGADELPNSLIPNVPNNLEIKE